MSATKIAIVGFGPRGAGALERLIARNTTDAGPLEATIFEPHPDLGAGPAYAHEQPEFLLMNFPASKVDVSWRNGSGPSSNLEQGSFAEWRGLDPDIADRWYPPRALIGRYLSDVANALLRSAPFPIALLPERVERIERSGEFWSLVSPSGTHRFDEVLLAVGHAQPAGPDSCSSQVGPIERVGIRGVGLTAIDLTLRLTEGRGGRFEENGRGRLNYVPSGREPAQIIPRSRSGRPMLVKPESNRGPAPHESVVAAVEAGCGRIRGLSPDAGIEGLMAALALLCGDLLQLERACAEASEWLTAAGEGQLRSEDDPVEAIRRSLRIDRGECSSDLPWALGLAWRELYPAIVERFSHGGLRASDRPTFLRLASELERLAFGPPPINAAKLLALVDAGILGLSLGPRGESGQIDVEIDAVIAPPGLHEGQAPLDGLRSAGFVRRPAGARGIEVTRQARCVGADGSVTPGLAACGRLTEDWLIGNDTLNRSLQPEIDGWAASVCAARSPVAPVGAPS